MRKVALVCAGGFCGTLARYVFMAPLLGLVGALFPSSPSGFPYDILAINLSGAFALGLLYGLSERGAAISPDVRLAVGTGFLGAYTTFSTFVFGGEKLLASGATFSGIFYLCGSVALGVLCAWAGKLAAAALTMRSRPLRRRWVRVRRMRRSLVYASSRALSQQAERYSHLRHLGRPSQAHPLRSLPAHHSHRDVRRAYHSSEHHSSNSQHHQWRPDPTSESAIPLAAREEDEISH